MLSEEFKNTIKVIYEKLKGSGIDWYLTGKTNLVLQGMDFSPKQIGILINFEDLEKFLVLFNDFKKNIPEELENKEAKEFIMEVSGTRVLVCAEYPHGTYMILNKKPTRFNLYGNEIKGLSLLDEFKAYEIFGEVETSNKIKKFLNSSDSF